jgi:vacuolar protein sorting-associated protein 54
MSAACDLANLRASKILGVRGEQHAGLKIAEFVQVYRANWDFVVKTEELGGRAIPSLRGVVAAQVCLICLQLVCLRLVVPEW